MNKKKKKKKMHDLKNEHGPEVAFNLPPSFLRFVLLATATNKLGKS